MRDPKVQALLQALESISQMFDPSAEEAEEMRAAASRAIDAFNSEDPEPQTETVGRLGDMGLPGSSHMTVALDREGDVHVRVWDATGGDQALASIEFCTLAGGGKSPRTRNALLALMGAMASDNTDRPEGQHPPAKA